MSGLGSVILLGVITAVLTAGYEECSVVEIKNLQGDFRNCARRNTEEHFNSEMVDTCELVKSVVESCGELWNRCHTIKEVRRMRDLHIEALVRQYGELGELDGCDLVEEYRQSGRTLADPVEEVTCSDDKTMEIQTKFQTCSHSTATSVYQTIQDITSVKIISHKLCKALTTIGTVCIKHLYQCFAEDDVKQMRKSHLEEMKTFLLRISEEKVTNNVFENCVVMEYVENEGQKLNNNTVDKATKSGEDDEVEINKDKVEKSPEKIVDSDSDTTTEKLHAKEVKGARHVETTPTANTNSDPNQKHALVTTLVSSKQKETTELDKKIKHTSDVVDEVPGDKSDGVDTKKDDKVVDEKIEGSAVKHTSGGGDGRRVMSAIVLVIILILLDKLW